MKMLLELIIEFNKVSGYNINIQKSVPFYTPTWTTRKKNYENNSTYNHIKKNIICRKKFKFCQGGKRYTLKARKCCWKKLRCK